MIKKILLLLLFVPLSLSSQSNKVQRYIKNRMMPDPYLQNAVVSILAVDHNNKVIAQWNPDMPLLTASTLKTITTGVALELLGPDFKYKTAIGYRGEIKDSVLIGDLYIIGGGDPTLGSYDSIATPIEEVFLEWRGALERYGIKEIDGAIIGDDRYFTNETVPSSWSWGNIGASYGAAASGLSFYENQQIFKISPGLTTSENALIEEIYPVIPGLHIINNVITKETGGSSLSYYTSDLATVSEFRGSVPLSANPSERRYSSKFSHLSCAWHFRDYLSQNGIVCKDTLVDIRSIEAPLRDSINVISTTYSPSLIDIINVTNTISNNFYAETLLKTIAKESTGVGSYDSAFAVIGRFINMKEISPIGYNASDGSGLSRQNYLSPRFFCNFYLMMEQSDNFALYFNSFPYPGGEGTLKSVLRDESDEVKKRIHAKSGSLANVRCYAGYVEGKKGLIRFAILVNNFSAPTSRVQPAIEGFMKELSLYGEKR